MVNHQYPFKGQQVLTLTGSEQTTSSLVVMIHFSSVRYLQNKPLSLGLVEDSISFLREMELVVNLKNADFGEQRKSGCNSRGKTWGIWEAQHF